MGFFSKLFASEPVALSISDEREAYASILVACMNTDGEISSEETTAFYTMLAARPFFAGRDISTLIDRVVGHHRKIRSSSALIDAAAGAIHESRRQTLFTACVDIVLADGQVTSEEEEILDYLKKKFSVDDSYASKAVEVLLVKNKV